MKKIRNILFMVFLLCGLVLTAGCGRHGKMSAEDFAAHMEEYGFLTSTVSSSEYGWKPNVGNARWRNDIQTVTRASKMPMITIEFYVWETEEKAVEWFEDRCRMANSIQEQGYTKIIEEKKTDDRAKIVIQSEEGYGIYSRIGNTTMHASGPNSGMKEVKKALKGTDY